MSATPAFVIPPDFNFAKRSGIISVPAAVFFSAVYLPLMCWFLFLLLRRNRAYVYTSLALFCWIRIPTFVIRTVLAAHQPAAEKLWLVIVAQVMFGAGFFGLLYSAYILVLDREVVTGHAPLSPNIFYKVTRNRLLFRFFLCTAILLGVVSASLTTATRTVSTDGTLLALRQGSTIIFFVLTVLQAFQTFNLTRLEFKDRAEGIYHGPLNSFGSKHSIFILSAMSVLLLVRQTFSMATVNDAITQNEEKYWYPFLALPELLAVLLYAIPGLVPGPEEEERAAVRRSLRVTDVEAASAYLSLPVDAGSRRRDSEETKVEWLTSRDGSDKRARSQLSSNGDTDTVVMSEKGDGAGQCPTIPKITFE